MSDISEAHIAAIELRVLDASGDLGSACAVGEFIREALEAGAISEDEIPDLIVTYEHITISEALPTDDAA